MKRYGCHEEFEDGYYWAKSCYGSAEIVTVESDEDTGDRTVWTFGCVHNEYDLNAFVWYYGPLVAPDVSE